MSFAFHGVCRRAARASNSHSAWINFRGAGQQHRHYLALLTILAELEEQGSVTKKASKKLAATLPSAQQQEYLREAASDLGQALFCWMHGGYKGCRVILRSSIELFVKGIACKDDPSVLTEKSLYKVFELAGLVPFFAKGPGKVLFSELYARYGDLSADVHTASAANMGKISALSYFPSFDPAAAKITSSHVIFVTNHLVVALCLYFNDAFHKMHHRNKETILEAVPASQKRRIQNVD